MVQVRHGSRNIDPLFHVWPAHVDGERMAPSVGMIYPASVPKSRVEIENASRRRNHSLRFLVKFLIGRSVRPIMRSRQEPGRAVLFSEIVEENRGAHVGYVARNNSWRVHMYAPRVVGIARRHRGGCICVNDTALSKHSLEGPHQAF